MEKGRDLRGRWLPGVCGAPPGKNLQKGHQWRFPKGVSGNPSGFTKRQAEFHRLQREALQDPELLELAMEKLRECIVAGEAWSIQWYLNRIWPDDPKQVLATKLEVIFVDKPLPDRNIIEAVAEPEANKGLSHGDKASESVK
jgi:hypothetical protein